MKITATFDPKSHEPQSYSWDEIRQKPGVYKEDATSAARMVIINRDNYLLVTNTGTVHTNTMLIANLGWTGTDARYTPVNEEITVTFK